jgi:hypothetical protein
MKFRVLALILSLTIVSWAQTATQDTPVTPQPSAEKVKCACCDKMAASDSKDAHAACMRQHEGKEMASCCAGKDEKSCCGRKDAKSCMKGGKMADCCKGKDGMNCDRKAGKDCGKGCCGSNKSEKPA